MKVAEHRRIMRVIAALAEGEAAPGIPKRLREEASGLHIEARRWLRYKSIQGLAVGTKTTAGRSTQEACIKIYVSTKRPKNRLRDAAPEFVPSLDDGSDIAVDVEQIGKLRFHTTVHPGISLANVTRTAGTLGLVVTPNDYPDMRCLLSCHHVMSPRETRATSVRHPSPADASSSGGRTVGHYWYSYPLVDDPNGYPNLADAALAVLKPGELWHNEAPHIGEPFGWTDRFRVGDYVRIYGRTSGWSTGQIEATSAYTDIWEGALRYGFAGQVMCNRYGQPGDSGSIVFDAFNRVIGLHIAGSSSRSFFTPIGPIFDFFGIDIAASET